MGNRAIITTMDRVIQVYVHWNGGYASVKAFLDYCKAKKMSLAIEEWNKGVQ